MLRCPGGVDTGRWEGVIRRYAALNSVSEAEARDALLAEIPSGRITQPEEVARAVVFLSSPSAGQLTGIVLPIDGGRIKGL
jgi:3-oxoacyl-[acyl-carrier protein] reductase